MARRRRFRRSFAGKSGGRRFFWFRDSPSAVTVREVATATHADILIDEGSWYGGTEENLNETQKGGARLERVILDFGLSVQANADWVRTSGDGNIAVLPEFMMWKQSGAFGTVVTNSSSFDSVRQSHRVIMDTVPLEEMSWALSPFTNEEVVRTVRGRYETKTKVRLSDAALGIGWRGFFDEGSVNVSGYTDWVRSTLLISLP